MLVIGDIHLTSKIKESLLNGLKKFISEHPQEENIIFLGDYVYHFSYDRNALLELFQFFLELYNNGKKVYILAGNHDWLGTTFVFEEGKKVFDLLNENWKIHFITKPRITTIENEKILFLPFCLNFNENEYEEYLEGESLFTEALQNSKDKNEKFSGKINQLVNGFIKKEKKLTIIHHYYFNKEKFPGYRSTFSYKDIALSEMLLDNPNISFISGHLHAPFIYKNYLCTGSSRATSSLENNHLKGRFIYNKNNFSFYNIQINQYLEIEGNNKKIMKIDIINLFDKIRNLLNQNFNSSKHFTIKDFQCEELNLNTTTLTMKVDQVNYNDIDKILDEDIRTKISDYKLKKNISKMGELLKNLERPSEENLQTFSGWKDLLKNFLRVHYPSEYEHYEQELKQLNIL